jgi:protoheme IX farnesyltransferase
MMPVVAGERSTRAQILAYACTLVPVTLLPVAIGIARWPYGLGAAMLGAGLLRHALRVYRDEGVRSARGLFFFSILYLFLIFAALLLDRALTVLA